MISLEIHQASKWLDNMDQIFFKEMRTLSLLYWSNEIDDDKEWKSLEINLVSLIMTARYDQRILLYNKKTTLHDNIIFNSLLELATRDCCYLLYILLDNYF